MKRIKIKKSVLRQYTRMRYFLPRKIKKYESLIAYNRIRYINKIINSIENKSIKDAKKIIRKAPNQDFMKRSIISMFEDFGIEIAEDQYKILQSKKAEEDEDLLREQWLADLRFYEKMYSGGRIKILTKSTKKQLLKYLDTFVSDAVEQGQSIEVVTKEIHSLLLKKMKGLNEWQSRRIAHTEVMHAAGKSQEISVNSLGIKYLKVWQITGIRTRRSHQAMQGVAVEKGKPFDVNGSKLMFPADSSLGAEAGEVVNCSCFLVYQTVK